MKKLILTVIASATLLCSAAALAAPTAQQSCDKTRVNAWKKYLACVNRTIATDAGKDSFDFGKTFVQFAKCRHAYFKNWSAFQSKASLASSTCIGNRFTDNGDGTVADGLTGLVWEKKTSPDGAPNLADPHDADNVYTWSAAASPLAESGTAFSDFVIGVNSGGGLAATNDWRLPTIAELQTILADFPCTGLFGTAKCSCDNACVDPAVGPTRNFDYWVATSYLPDAELAWTVTFAVAGGYRQPKTGSNYVRAVRGGF